MNPLKIIVLLMGWPFYGFYKRGVIEMTPLTELLYHCFYNTIGHYYDRANEARLYHLLYVACTAAGWLAFLGMLYLYHTGVVVINMRYYMDMLLVYIVAALVSRWITTSFTLGFIGFCMELRVIFRNMLYTYRNKKQS